ncbi:hypothetical protein Y032_0056g2657 [Ancylostoma ceylanicum]|uniref:Uncharacterized protein n=1 Tax=Ancylostoma ceylanicum TaxID=53326 RepID=A0A016U5Q7_9BILA|nr:hypothetical protein Y032_0056g2657 [Ancylostoma ceylanicum]
MNPLCTVSFDGGDPFTALTSTPRNRAARGESMSFSVIMLLLIMKYEKSGKITKLGRKTPINSTPTAGDNDSGTCGAVTRRP